MKIEELVLSVEQMQHLKELGLEVKDTAVVLDSWDDPNLSNTYFEEDLKECTPTLTLQEILEILPGEIKRGNDRMFLIVNKADRSISYMSKDYNERLDSVCITADGGENFLTDAYYMLCWVSENGYLTASKSKQ